MSGTLTEGDATAGLSQAQSEWAASFCGVAMDGAPDPAAVAKPKTGASPPPDPKVAKAQDTAKKVDGMADADLQKMSSADKVALLKDIKAAGKPTGDLRKAQIKIFRNMQLDPDFKKREAARADKAADEVKDDPDVNAAASGWAKLSKDQKIKAVKRVMEAQCKQLGLPVPPILPYDKPADPNGTVEDGNYDPSDGKLHFNTNPDANKTFTDAMDTAVHETSHAYQNDIVKRLKDGKIKPGDPDYAQAEMFAANDDGDDYIQPTEDMAAYVAQPEENHARIVAADYIDKIQKKLTGPAAAKKP
jgi:hypothetical protein